MGPGFRLIVTPPAPGAWNMALDEALMDSVRDGADPVLRFYGWDPACLSLGRNQPAAGLYDEAEIARRGLEVVRRPTGGRAVVHARELTYTVVVGERALGSLRQTYARINTALVAGVRALGVPAQLQPRPSQRAVAPSLSPCFQDPAEGEVVVGGRKLIGSAQYRHRGVLLQHGSLLLHDDQRLLTGLTAAPEPAAEAPPAVLADHLSPLPGPDVLVAALATAFTATTGAELRREDPQPREIGAARALHSRYGGMAWTWRR